MKIFSIIKDFFLALKKNTDIKTTERIEEENSDEIQEPAYNKPKAILQKKESPKVYGVRKKFTALVFVGLAVLYLVAFIFSSTKDTDKLNPEISDASKNSSRQSDAISQFPNKYGRSISADTGEKEGQDKERVNPLPENKSDVQNSGKPSQGYDYQIPPTPPVNYQGSYYPSQFVEIPDQKNTANVDANDYHKSPIGFGKFTGSTNNAAANKQAEQVQSEEQPGVQSNTSRVNTNNMALSPISYVQPQLYTLQQGAIIPVTLLTGINSDLPGQIIAQVRENVYDSISGGYLLIPQGSRILGEVKGSSTSVGQERIGVNWQRLIFPNGVSIDLGSMEGVDAAGYAGLRDKVNNHMGKIISATLISSLLAAGTQIAAGNTGDTSNQSASQLALSGAATSVMNAGAKLMDRNININPTIEIRPGIQFNVFVNKDLVLKPYR